MKQNMKVDEQVRVLVVDDDTFVRQLTSMRLAPEGYQVILACDGEEALDVVGQQPIDIILLDVMMPGLDGFEVCQRLKSDPTTATIPVILITALTSEESHAQALAVGADDFMSKPVKSADLLAAIQRLLSAAPRKRL